MGLKIYRGVEGGWGHLFFQVYLSPHLRLPVTDAQSQEREKG